MTLTIGGPVPVAATPPTATTQTGTALAVSMARQAAATPDAEVSAPMANSKAADLRPLAYGLNAPMATHKAREITNENRPRAANPQTRGKGKGNKLDVEV